MPKISSKVLILLVITVVLFASLLIYKSGSAQNVAEKIVSNPNVVAAIPSPFKEMTIPYLRDRNYKSRLGQLKEYSNSSNYVSYLTSYDSDGLRINGLLTIPQGQKPENGWPAIVFIHGYIPPSDYETTTRYGDYVDYLARNGFVVFKIDLRGHGESDGEAGGAYYSGNYIIDTLNARDALITSNFVNPDKVGLWGHSMAGNVVLRSLAARPEIPVAVIWAGAVYSYEDFTKYRLNDSSYRPPDMSRVNQGRRQEVLKKYGDINPDNPFWKIVAPTNYLTDLKGAIQLNHSIDDTTVNIGYSRDLNFLLDKTSVPHEFHEYQGGGHNISGLYFIEAMQNTVNFFDKYLK